MIDNDVEYMKFEELLPFYVNKTLNADDKAFMHNYLKRNPECQAQVNFTEALSLAVNDVNITYSNEPGLTKLLERFQALHKKPAINQRIKTFLHQWGFTPAFGLAFGLLVLQTTAILQFDVFSARGTEYRGISNQFDYSPHLKVTINPQTDYAQLVVLFRKNGCRVVSGPSENGELWVHLDEPKQLDIIILDLFNSGLVDEVLTLTTNGQK